MVFYLLAFPFLQGCLGLALGRSIRSSAGTFAHGVRAGRWSGYLCRNPGTSGHIMQGPSGAGSTTSVEGVSPGTPVNLDSVVALAQAKVRRLDLA